LPGATCAELKGHKFTGNTKGFNFLKNEEMQKAVLTINPFIYLNKYVLLK